MTNKSQLFRFRDRNNNNNNFPQIKVMANELLDLNGLIFLREVS